MRLHKLVLHHVRNFNSQFEVHFQNTDLINTVSGRNGSGKTTVFKCLALCQKAFYVRYLEDTELIKVVAQELSKYFLDASSYIELSFCFENDGTVEYHGFRIVCVNFGNDISSWDIKFEPASLYKIAQYWKIENPQNIIVYIDSNKYISEQDIKQDNISVKSSSSENALLLDAILYPERFFTNIYQRLITDYLYERLVPARPRRDLSLLPTKILLKELMPNIHLGNFTGQLHENQFVYLGKSSIKAPFYDIRNFSSGEKSMFYLLLFLNYSQRIDLLVIDEPENNIHEDLLIKFVRLLTEISKSNNYYELLIRLADKNGIKLTDNNLIELQSVYSKYSLSKIFFLTHSKNLIYSVFQLGSNFYLDKTLKKIEYDKCEKILRDIGISTINSSVLFVEGSSDTDFLQGFFNEYNIKIHALNGCSAVIDTYRKIIAIKQYLIDTNFCFLIDRDSRNNVDVERIREVNPRFFDEHFIILEKHEFENYLLSPNIYKSIIERHATLYKGLDVVDITKIEKEISGIAYENRRAAFKKELSNSNQQSIDSLKEMLVTKHIPIDSESSYMEYLSSILSKVNLNELITNKFIEDYQTGSRKYDHEEWSKNWQVLCDGKITLNKTIEHYAKYLGINRDRLKSEIKQEVFSDKSLDIHLTVSRILEMFNRK